MKRPGPIVEIQWVDSTGRSDWHDPQQAVDLDGLLECVSVGYLISETPRSVTISQGSGSMGNYLSSMAIPRVAIVKLTQVRKR